MLGQSKANFSSSQGEPPGEPSADAVPTRRDSLQHAGANSCFDVPLDKVKSRQEEAMQTITLSEAAVATLRFEITGWKKKPKIREIDIPGYRELVAAGIMEPDGEGFRLTAEGLSDGEAIVEREQERIESGRYTPPDVSHLSGYAWGQLRRIASGEDVTVTPENLPLLRELAEARIVLIISTFAGGPESAWRWTYWGWKRKPEWVEIACAKAAG
jgi:hypothetical protein